YHFLDFPGAKANIPDARGASILNPAFGVGNEFGWGVMDHIKFCQIHNKPLCVPEMGYFFNGHQQTPDVALAGYLKSRFAYAQSVGVDVLFASWFVADPNNVLGVTPAAVPSVKAAFGGT